MMESSLLVSTVLRNASPHEPSAALWSLDASLAVCETVDIPDSQARSLDRNPRGGTRGARGIAVAGDEVFVANYETVFRFDRNWKLRGALSHPECADIHDIAFRDGRLWVASTRNDLLFQFDLDGKMKETIDPWECGDIADAFGVAPKKLGRTGELRDPRTHDKSTTDRLHLNSFAFMDDGRLLVSLGQVRVNSHCESAVLRLGANGGYDVIHGHLRALVPAHNVLPMLDGTVLHCDTASAQVVRIDPSIRVGPQPVIETNGGYTRGLCRLGDGTIAVGVQNEVWLFNPNNRNMIHKVRVSNDSRVSVHSIAPY